jgi:uncharacterized membrane protein
MALGDRITIGRFGMAAIAAAVVTALAVASPAPAWGQDTGDQAGGPAASQAETRAPDAMMQMMMDRAGDGGNSAPLIGHGFLLDKGVFTTIDHPDAVAETTALAINNRGQIVGGYVDAEGTARSFLLDDGVFTPIDHPDAASGPGAGTVARDINKRGQIVGLYADAEGTIHGFLRDKEGVFAPIDHPDALQEPRTGTAVFGINDRGQIVGFYDDDGAVLVRGFLLESHDDPSAEGVFTAIDFPGAVVTGASAINNRGEIAGGYSDVGGTMHGFLRDKKGAFSTIDHPDAASGIVNGKPAGTALFGLNNRGQLVGQYVDADLRCHGLLLSRGAFTTIDDPDALSHTGASDINDRGQIVGFRDSLTGLTACSTPDASASASAPESTDQ